MFGCFQLQGDNCCKTSAPSKKQEPEYHNFQLPNYQHSGTKAPRTPSGTKKKPKPINSTFINYELPQGSSSGAKAPSKNQKPQFGVLNTTIPTMVYSPNVSIERQIYEWSKAQKK